MIDHLTYLAATTGSSGLQTAWEYLQKGGIFMIPLGLTSIAGMMAIFYKALSLSSKRVIPQGLAQDVDQFQAHIVNNSSSKVIQEFEKGESALARLAAVVMKHRGKSRFEITHSVESVAREEVLRLHAGISVLDTIITIAPLLGLLGTASGLVTIFQGLGDQADHLAIAHGIAEALTTTIFGLAIAVPCVVAHGYFVRRIEMLTARLESLLSTLTHACEKPTSLT
jgi:biopolymer transport protein ExbB